MRFSIVFYGNVCASQPIFQEAIMNHFEEELHAELLNNQFLLQHCQEILRDAPPGRLFIRQRKPFNP